MAASVGVRVSVWIEQPLVSRKWLKFEGGVISGLFRTRFGPKASFGAPAEDHAMRTHKG